LDIAELRKWIGREERVTDVITAAPVRALAATLDRDDPEPRPGDALPPLWNWLYFLPAHRQSELGADGHARRGGFLPPVALPRRMWAGGRFEFHRTLRIGETVERVSRIVDVKYKEGRSGRLVFVVVRHEIGDAVVEEQDIVYRDSGAAPRAALAGHGPAPHWERVIHPDDVLLFRYSALTFNGHRIHYDRRYATEVEGHPGLVVHGPLLATLLLDLVQRSLPQMKVTKFEFRAVGPLFDTAPFAVCGRREGDGVKLWAREMAGGVAMEAAAE
jgi:3-methylfumaryl-CoA hydratase